MDETNVKLRIMSDLLDKKLIMLNSLNEYTKSQAKALQTDDKLFFAISLKKQELIDEVLKIDEVFTRMFNEIKDILKPEHKEPFDTLKEKIKAVIDFDVSVRVNEEKNKRMTSNATQQKINLPKSTSKNAVNAYTTQSKHTGRR